MRFQVLPKKSSIFIRSLNEPRDIFMSLCRSYQQQLQDELVTASQDVEPESLDITAR